MWCCWDVAPIRSRLNAFCPRLTPRGTISDNSKKVTQLSSTFWIRLFDDEADVHVLCTSAEFPPDLKYLLINQWYGKCYFIQITLKESFCSWTTWNDPLCLKRTSPAAMWSSSLTSPLTTMRLLWFSSMTDGTTMQLWHWALTLQVSLRLP